MSLVLWKWTENDFKVPLHIKLADSTASLYLEEPRKLFASSIPKANDSRQWVYHCSVVFNYGTPEEDFHKGLLKPNSERGTNAARKIYGDYLKCLETMVTYARLVLSAHSVDEWARSSYSNLFHESFTSRSNVTWSTDGKTFIDFVPVLKKSSKINPIFKSEALIWPRDWIRLQTSISKGPAPTVEVRELLKLRTKIAFNEKRVSIVESMAIIEMALKNIVTDFLQEKGVSKTRLGSLREEAGLSIFLNFMLPLCLSNSLYKRALPLIQRIDKLRKIRNEIMHENLTDDAIDKEDAYSGVDSCISLLNLLVKSRKWSPVQNSQK